MGSFSRFPLNSPPLDFALIKLSPSPSSISNELIDASTGPVTFRVTDALALFAGTSNGIFTNDSPTDAPRWRCAPGAWSFKFASAAGSGERILYLSFAVYFLPAFNNPLRVEKTLFVSPAFNFSELTNIFSPPPSGDFTREESIAVKFPLSANPFTTVPASAPVKNAAANDAQKKVNIF